MNKIIRNAIFIFGFGAFILPGHLIINLLNFLSFKKLEQKRYTIDNSGFIKYINDSALAGFLVFFFVLLFFMFVLI